MSDNMFTGIMEFCVEHGVALDNDQIESARQTFNEDGGVEDAAAKVIDAAADDPSNDESQVDYDIDLGKSDNAQAGGVSPEDILSAISKETDDTDEFVNDEDDIAKANESAMSDQEFYGLLYEFMNENGIDIPDSAMATFQEAGIFDNDGTDYTNILEFFVSNNVALDEDQMEALRYRFS